MSFNIFDNKNILLFEPEDGIELIHHILQNINHNNNFKTIEVRRDGLRTINRLFELDLIEVFHWGKYENEFKNNELPIFEKMMYIQELWFIGADIDDFYNMPMFKYKNWYIDSLEKLGLTHFIDWETFVKEKIENLENWIEENRPKQ